MANAIATGDRIEKEITMPTLHGIEVSPFVRKVRIVLAEKGVDYEINPVMHFALPEGYEKLHPLRKIPVWTTDDGDDIPDSSAIVAYLDKAYPSPRVMPEDAVELGRALFLEEYSDTAVAMNVATIFLEKFASPRFFGKDPDQKKIDAARTHLATQFAYLEEVLGSRDHMVGDSFSVADAALASCFTTYRHTELEVDAGQHPNLRRYADAMLARPTTAAIFEEEVEKYANA